MDRSADHKTIQHDAQAMLSEVEVMKISRDIVVPSLVKDVVAALRNIGQPIKIFGEEPHDVRSRLRTLLIQKAIADNSATKNEQHRDTEDGKLLVERPSKPLQKESPVEISYTHGIPELIEARQEIFKISGKRTSERLEREAKLRRTCRNGSSASESESTNMELNNGNGAEARHNDYNLLQLHQSTKRLGLEGSQIGDTRTLSCVCSLSPGGSLVATGGWSGTLKVWDAKNVGEIISKPFAHQNRIMGIASSSATTHYEANTSYICTTSLDLTAKLWKLTIRDLTNKDTEEMKDENDVSNGTGLALESIGTLTGHGARLCRAVFHPSGRQVFTTSFDRTWRMWDVERSQELLLQDSGHDRETFGVGIHPDGSLIAVTDFAGVVRLWDLRSGKAIHHFVGHAKRVLCAEFHPFCGFQLSTAGDDGTIRVWDLRQRTIRYTIPAHSNIITQLRYLPFEGNGKDPYNSGEILASSSFDKTLKLWCTRDWRVLSTLKGHEGCVTGVDFVKPNSEGHCSGKTSAIEDPFQVVSCGFDKTLKVLREQKGMIL